MVELGENTVKPTGFIYTFYSYKGGVGRSMAVANVGTLMALKGYKVLLVDWDLEAPGLEVFFEKTKQTKLSKNASNVKGVVDLLEAKADGKPLDWHKCIVKAEFPGASLDIICAGQSSQDYRKRVQRLNWRALFQEHGIGNYLDGLREEWRNEYDFILIDSRTGITDIGDICTVLLPDALVPMFVSNFQNVMGVKSIVSRAREARSKLPVNRNMLMVLPLPSRDEGNTEYEESLRWKGIFDAELGFLFKEWLPREVSPAEALAKFFIPYVSIWSFGERIPVLESKREMLDPSSIGAAYMRLTTLLSSRLDWYAIYAAAGAQELQATQLRLKQTLAERDQIQSGRVNRTRRALLYGAGSAGLGITALAFTYKYFASEIPTAIVLPKITGRLNFPIYDALYNPDGTLLATASSDNTARIWDATTGETIHTLSGHEGSVYHLAWNEAGTRIATASSDNTASIWDATTGKIIHRLIGHENSVYHLAWNEAGTRIATASDDGTALIWNAITGETIHPLSGHKEAITHLAWSPDGIRIATASFDGTALIWDTITGEAIHPLSGHKEAINHLAWSPDGTRIATASNDDTARIWDAATGKTIHSLSGHEDFIFHLAWNKSGTRIATASDDSTARIWDVTIGETEFTLEHEDIVDDLAWNVDGTRIATASKDKTVRIWNTRNGKNVAVLSDALGAIHSVEYSPTGLEVLTASSDGAWRIYDVSRY